MARALKNITATATKKPKKRATSLATLKLGDEPSFIFEPSLSELVRALNWYTQCSDDPELHKAWITEFLKKRGWNNDNIRTVISKIKKMIGTHIFIARMFNRDQPIDIKYDAEALAYFEGVLAKHEEELDEEGNPIAKTSPTKINTNVAEMVEFIELAFDNVLKGHAYNVGEVYKRLQALGCNAAAANQLKNIFKLQTAEYIELSRNPCEQLDEGYGWVSKKNRKAIGVFVLQLNEDLSSFVKMAKATRKPRKKKPVKLEKLVGRMKFKVKDETYKVASVQPEKVIGASWLWTFNTKYRTIAFYEAGEGGLSVKGTTILNAKASGQKKLRKPEQQLAGFTSGAVKALPKQFDLIKTTSSEPNGRINADTILLRVF